MASALIFTMCYWPEPTGIGPMATDLAESLAARGWKITVVTGFPLMPDWQIQRPYRRKIYQREMRNDTEIFRSWVYCPRRPRAGVMKTWKRILFDSTLVLTATLTLLSRKRPDVIVAIGPPLQTGFASLFLKWLWHRPVLYWMQDIVPDAAVNVGMMREGLALKLARRMERAVYEGVDRIGIISEGFRTNLLAKSVPARKQAFLPNWADARVFDRTPFDPAPGLRRKDFIVMHAGSMGAKQCLGNVLRAARNIEDESIRLVLLGGGNCADAIKAEAGRLKLRRVTFLPTAGQDDYVNALRAADVLLINQAGAIVDALVPSKLLTYLLAEKPVLAAVSGSSETARFVRDAQCGLVVEPDDPAALASGIMRLKRNPAERTQMGAAGAAFVRDRFDKAVLLERFAGVLSGMVDEG